jgi:MFS family permease
VIGGTPTDAGFLVAIGSFVYAISASQTGRVTAFFDSRITPLLFANAGLGIGLGIVIVAPDIVIAGLGIALCGFGFGIMLSLIRSIITGLASESLRGGLVSVAEANGRLAGTVTPIFMGGIITLFTPIVGFSAAVQLAGFSIAIIGSVGGIACMVVVKYSPPPPSAVTTI